MRIGMAANLEHGTTGLQSRVELQSQLDPVPFVKEYAQAGIRHFELLTDTASLMECMFHERTVQALLEQQRAYDLTFSVHMPYRVMDLSYPAKAVADAVARHFADIIDRLEPLRPLAYVIHPASPVTGKLLRAYGENSPLTDSLVDTLVYSMVEICRLTYLPVYRLALKNTSVPFFLNQKALDRLPVSLCLDQGNLFAHRSGDPAKGYDLLDRYFDRIVGVYIHDVALAGGKVMDHLPLGEGDADWETFLQELYVRGYEGFLVPQVHSDTLGALNSVRRISEIFEGLSPSGQESEEL